MWGSICHHVKARGQPLHPIYPLGENLLAPKRRLGFGLERIVGPDFIAEISNKVIITRSLVSRPRRVTRIRKTCAGSTTPGAA